LVVDSLDMIEISLNKALSIADLLSCIGEKPTLENTCREIGSELVELIHNIMGEIKELNACKKS